ncbi:MAG: class I SAM-dependent methyltransferase [Anaerolineales bacterium]|jgi:ubiquinone/menaquinone biosynthesis C-methylase UbiE
MAMTGFEKRFVNRPKKGERNARIVRRHLQNLGTDRIHDALELGCGIGSVAAFLAREYGMQVVGTDFDPEQIDAARRFNPENERLRYQVEDASALSFPDESFDLVVSQNVFHHVHGWEKAVMEVARVLRRGGYFIWVDFSYPAFMKRIFQPLVKNYGLYTWREIQRAFGSSGLVPLDVARTRHAIFRYHNVLLQKP